MSIDWSPFVVDWNTVTNIELVFPMDLKDQVKSELEAEGWKITQIGPLLVDIMGPLLVDEIGPIDPLVFDPTRCKIKAYRWRERELP